MIAAWILYCTALGVIFVTAALPLERYVHERGGSTRRVWALTLAGTILVPLIGFTGPGLVGGATPAAFSPPSPTTVSVVRGVEALTPLDGLLGSVWLATSVGLALLLFGAIALTAWRRRGWVEQTVDGVDVLVSDDVGPAVVGVVRSRIVVPRWVLALPPLERQIMLRHELEHVSAGDPRLLVLGALAPVLMPWNLAVWFMVRRVRLAIEVDCDRRVMGRGDLDLRRYAELLLTVGARRRLPSYGVGFSVGRPFLEQRIDRMTMPAGEGRRAHAVLVALGVAGVLAAAWALPEPVGAEALIRGTSCDVESAETSLRLLEAADWST